MPKKATFTSTVTGGKISPVIGRHINDVLTMYEGKLVNITLGPPVRSTEANAYYWALLNAIQAGAYKAGDVISPDDLHVIFGDAYLPVRMVVVGHHAARKRPTTTTLDSTEFSRYIDQIKNDSYVQNLDLDFDFDDMPPGDRHTIRE